MVNGDSISNIEVNDTSNTNNKNTSNKQVNLSEYSLDKKIEAVLGSTRANTEERANFLNGLVKFGQISQSDRDYLIGV